MNALICLFVHSLIVFRWWNRNRSRKCPPDNVRLANQAEALSDALTTSLESAKHHEHIGEFSLAKVRLGQQESLRAQDQS